MIPFYFTVKVIYGGCLAVNAEPWFRNRKLVEQYFPADFTVEDYEFNKCTGDNCFALAPEGTKHIAIFTSLAYVSASFCDEYSTQAPSS